jgi:hypothetical protein
MSRARRRFEERKRKLRKIDAVYNWRYTNWDGKHIYADWSHYWFRPEKEKPIKWWKHSTWVAMSESGHHRTWQHPMMVKPWRTNCKQIQRDITAGRVDPDEVLFPVYCRPWVYYW